jgi:hypothetical protein
MSGSGISRKEYDLVPDNGFNTIRGFGAASTLNVFPDLDKVGCGLGREDITRSHFVLAFSFAR